MRNAPITIKDPFGLLAFLHWNHEWNQYHFNEQILPKAIAQLKDLGISMIRVDFLWSDVQKRDDSFDFARYDRMVSLLRDGDIDILGVLQYNKIDRTEDGKEMWNHPPDDPREFAHYVFKTVEHFRDDVRYWEIWNEPNHPIYWTGPKDGLKRYGELLKLSYEQAKAAEPSCIVMNGGITDPVLEDLDHYYENGLNKYSDVLNIHIFLDPLSPDRLKKFETLILKVHQKMNQMNEGEKKIWITEVGCPGIPVGAAPQKWFGGESVNEDIQARWLEEVFTLIQRLPYVEKLFWAFYRDTQNEHLESANFFGLVKGDLTPKLAFHQFQKLIRNFYNLKGKTLNRR